MKIKILLLIAILGTGFYIGRAEAQNVSSSILADNSSSSATSSAANATSSLFSTTTISNSTTSSSTVAATSSSSTDLIGCDISGDLSKLEKLEEDMNNAVSPSQKQLVEDLKIRRDILNKSLSCEINNINNLKSDLSGAQTGDDQSAALKSQYLKDLNNITAFYSSQKSKVGKLGISGTKQISEEILNKKQDDFNSQTQMIIDFVLWEKNQSVMSSLGNKIQDVNRYLKLWSLFDKDAINNNFKNSQSDLSMAQEISQQIENSFSSSTVPVSQVNDLTKSFLQSIYNTYQDLINLQSNIKKILP